MSEKFGEIVETTQVKGSISTIDVSLTGADALRYIEKTEATGAPWQLVGDLEVKLKGQPDVLNLELWIDGADTPLKIKLFPNGQWQAKLTVQAP